MPVSLNVSQSQLISQLKVLIESEDAYGSAVEILNFNIKSNNDIDGKFKDNWNNRVFSFVVESNRIGYKPAISLTKSDSEESDRFDAFSQGYLFLEREDGKPRTGKSKCTAVSYSCGKSCIQLQKTCWIDDLGNKPDKPYGSVASISQGRIDKLRTLARYLAANGNNQWSKYGSADVLQAKAKELERVRGGVFAKGVKLPPVEVPQPSREFQLKVKVSDLKRAIADAFTSGDFTEAQSLAKEVSGMIQSGMEAVNYLAQIGGDIETQRQKLKEQHKAVIRDVNDIKNNKNIDQADEHYNKEWTQESQKLLENYNNFTKKVAREFIYVADDVKSQIKEKIIGVVNPTNLKKIKSTTPQHTSKVRKALDDFERMIGVDYVKGKEIEVAIINPAAAKSQRAFALGNAIYISEKNPNKIIIHEAAHVIERSYPDIHKKIQKFFNERTKGDKWEPLRKLTGSEFYGANEVAKKDRWINPYMGKRTSKGNSEILSMGMEMMYTDPVGFAKKDPDYFAFIYDTLRGK